MKDSEKIVRDSEKLANTTNIAIPEVVLPVWYRAGVVCTERLLIFGTYSIGFVLGSYIFMD